MSLFFYDRTPLTKLSFLFISSPRNLHFPEQKWLFFSVIVIPLEWLPFHMCVRYRQVFLSLCTHDKTTFSALFFKQHPHPSPPPPTYRVSSMTFPPAAQPTDVIESRLSEDFLLLWPVDHAVDLLFLPFRSLPLASGWRLHFPLY